MRSDRATLRAFLDKIEQTSGRAKRMWVMDRGPSDRSDSGRDARSGEADVLLGGNLQKQDQTIRTEVARSAMVPPRGIRDSVEVKLFEEQGELYTVRTQARAGQERPSRQLKEMAIRRKKLARLLWTLRASAPQRGRRATSC